MAGIKLIIDNDAVRERMSLQDLDDINEAIDSGLNAAHVFLEGALGSKFAPVTGQKDLFLIDSNLLDPIGSMFRLRLKRMFIKGTPVVTYADSRKEVLAGGTVIPDEDITLDSEKGLLFVDEGYADKYVQVEYSAGFDSDNPAPDWLKEAALAYMPGVLESAGSGSEPSKIGPADSQRLAGGMVDGYKRETALQFSPLY